LNEKEGRIMKKGAEGEGRARSTSREKRSSSEVRQESIEKERGHKKKGKEECKVGVGGGKKEEEKYDVIYL